MSIASLESFWNPLTCFAICAMVYVVGEFFSHLTKGNISSLMFASFLFLIGFWLDVFPADITTKPGIAAAMSNFGVALLITNLGTMINLETICKEWKTALIALLGLGGILIAAFTFGTWLFGREYALMAAPPISGGTIAGILVQTAANDAGRPELAAFAILVLAFQKFFGMPVATTGMKKEIERLRKSGQLLNPPKPAKELKLPSMRFIPDTPKALNTSNMYLFKLAIVGMLANFVGLATRIPGDGPANYILNPNIAYLLFGLIFTRIGFLEKQSLQKSHSYGLCMIGLMLMLPGSLANVTPMGLLEMILPLVGMLAISTVFICIIASIVGKLVGYSPWISCAIACTCMIGYPGTEILSNEAVAGMEGTEEEKAAALNFVLPKMIVGGFVTVTIASVAFAGVIAPIIFI